jgi:hypothetical protein
MSVVQQAGDAVRGESHQVDHGSNVRAPGAEHRVVGQREAVPAVPAPPPVLSHGSQDRGPHQREADRRSGTTSSGHLMAAALAGCLQQALGIAAIAVEGGGGAPSVEATVTLRTGEEAGYTAAYELVVHGLDDADGAHVLDEARRCARSPRRWKVTG